MLENEMKDKVAKRDTDVDVDVDVDVEGGEEGHRPGEGQAGQKPAEALKKKSSKIQRSQDLQPVSAEMKNLTLLCQSCPVCSS